MFNLFRAALVELEGVFHVLEGKFERPEFIDDGILPRFRHKNKSREIAISLKAARLISGLNAVWYLLPRGFVQEIGVIFRTIVHIFNKRIAYYHNGTRE